MLTMWLMLWKWNNKNNELQSGFFSTFRTSALSVFWVSRSLVFEVIPFPSGLIEIKRKSCNCIIFFVCSNAYLSRPILLEIFSRYWSYNIMLIDVSLVWLSFMKQGPRCARSVGHDPEPNISSCPTLPLSNEYTVFRFCTSHCYH